ncbi:MAG TPA: regulatory protein RecX [Thermoleophilia bacterium]|nr:regulatory protein RecX [Thermoleophilia bacterium]
MGLTEGTLLEGTSLKRVLDEGERGAARARALRYLETRERSRVEVERRLARYGYGPELVSEVVKWLAHLGYVDDRRFAQWLVRSRSQGSWGPRRITQDLLSRGVERSIVKEAVGAARLAGADQAQVVDELAIVMQRRFAHDLGADPARAERRISAYLERRGHGWDIIRLVVRRLSTSEMAAAEDDPGNAGVS